MILFADKHLYFVAASVLRYESEGVLDWMKVSNFYQLPGRWMTYSRTLKQIFDVVSGLASAQKLIFILRWNFC